MIYVCSINAGTSKTLIARFQCNYYSFNRIFKPFFIILICMYVHSILMCVLSLLSFKCSMRTWNLNIIRVSPFFVGLQNVCASFFHQNQNKFASKWDIIVVACVFTCFKHCLNSFLFAIKMAWMQMQRLCYAVWGFVFLFISIALDWCSQRKFDCQRSRSTEHGKRHTFSSHETHNTIA